MCQSDKGQALRFPGQRSCYCVFKFKCKHSAYDCGCMVDGGSTMAAI